MDDFTKNFSLYYTAYDKNASLWILFFLFSSSRTFFLGDRKDKSNINLHPEKQYDARLCSSVLTLKFVVSMFS